MFKCIVLVLLIDVLILILGESGFGKEFVVCVIYENSFWWDGLFVMVNIVVFSELFVESEFFGYVCGVYMGVSDEWVGFFEMVDKGMLFFDEIVDIFLVV